MKLFTSLLFILLPAISIASSEAHHSEGIPKVVIYQFINVAILVAGIIYFAKDGVVAFFADRKAAYLAAAEKSAQAREAAEKNFAELNLKLSQLNSSREDAIKRARENASEMKQQIISEAALVSKRISDEARLTAKLEIERAQRELRNQLLKDSIEAAKMVLSKDINAADHEKLQKDFASQVGV